MARNIEDIQRDIERTRRQLAGTLDELAQRSNPQNFANEAKTAATDKLQDRNVQMVLRRCGWPDCFLGLPLSPPQERPEGAAAPAVRAPLNYGSPRTLRGLFS